MARTIRSDRSGEPASTPPSRRTGSLLIAAIGFLFTAWSLMELLAPGRDYQTHRLEFYSVDDIRWLSPEAARVGGVPLTTESQADGTVRHRIELTETASLPIADIRSLGFEFDVAELTNEGAMVPGHTRILSASLSETGGAPPLFRAGPQRLATESAVELSRIPGAAWAPSGTNQRSWQLDLMTPASAHLALRAHVTVPGFVTGGGPYVPSPLHGLVFHRLGASSFGLESGPRYAFPFGFYTTAAKEPPSSRAALIAFLWAEEGGTAAVLRWITGAIAVVLTGLCLFPRTADSRGSAWRAGPAAGAIFLGCGMFHLVVTPPFNGVNEPAHIFSYHNWWGDTNATQTGWELGLRNHHSRLQWRPAQKFTDGDRGQAIDHFILHPGTMDTHPAARSGSAAVLWRASRPWIAGKPVATQIFRLRLLSLLVVAGGIALGVGLLARPDERGFFTPWLGWSVMLLPSLPFLSMNVSNYPVLLAAGLVLASAAAACVDRRRLDPWPGLLLGAASSVALHTSRSAQPVVLFLGLLLAAIPVARLCLPPGDTMRIWRFWGALTIGLLLGRLVSNAGFDAEAADSVARFATKLGLRRIPAFWLVTTVLGSTGAIIDRSAAAWVAARARSGTEPAWPRTLRWAWLFSLVILAGMLSNAISRCPPLPPLREVFPTWEYQPGQDILLPPVTSPRPSDAHPSVREYVVQALRSAAGSIGPGDRDYMTSKLFWTQISDGDTFAPDWLIGVLTTLFATGAALHYWRISDRQDAARFVLVTAVFVGGAAYFSAMAAACRLGGATPSLHGRYVYVCYLILIVSASTGWKGSLLYWQQRSPTTLLAVVLGSPLLVQLLSLHAQMTRYF